MYRKNKSINRLKHLKYRNIYIKIDRNRMLDIVIHYSYVWNLSQQKALHITVCVRPCISTCTLYCIPFQEKQFQNRTWAVIMGSSDPRSTSGSSLPKSDTSSSHLTNPGQTPMHDINLTHPIVILSVGSITQHHRRWHCHAPHLSEAKHLGETKQWSCHHILQRAVVLLFSCWWLVAVC
jgi:hypothetical protein